MSKKGYIYKYTYPNGKVYIGQTMNLEQRHYQHMYGAKKRENNQLCEKAIRKYGEPQLEVLEEIEVDDKTPTKLIEILDEKEKEYIVRYNSIDTRFGYNIKTGGHIKTPKQFILEEKWYEFFEKDGWGQSIAVFEQLLESIKNKLFVTKEKLDKDEKYCWYGYKFEDKYTGKTTTFNGFYKRHEFLFDDIGDLPYDVEEALYGNDENKKEWAKSEQDKIFFDNFIKDAMDSWIEDIRQTIWSKIMKKQNRIITNWYRDNKRIN